MSKEKRRVPKLRFPGFTEDWEQRKLGEIFEYLQNNTLSRDSLNYKIPNIKNIHYGDILVKFNEILDGSNKDIPYINPDLDLSKFSKSLLRDGDVIFSDTAEDDTVGKAIELQNVNAPFILSGLHTIPCRPLIPFGKGYLGNFFNSNSYRLQIRPLVQGIKVSSISKSALKDTMIKYPKNLDEQEKIGSLFQSITKMITLHQRKLNNLKLKRKALLQKLFPKNGEGYPELRFPGFTDAWEQRKLGDVADVRDGTHDSPKFYNDGFPLVTSKNLKDGSIDFSDCSFISKQDFDEINKRSKVDSGDILFGMIGTIGNPAIVEHTGFAIKNVALIKEGIIVNNRFIYHLLSSKVFDNYIARENAGGTQKFIALNQIRNFIFLAPTLEEQNKIIELLDYISQTITLHQRKLKHLQIQKKSLLQKLFV